MFKALLLGMSCAGGVDGHSAAEVAESSTCGLGFAEEPPGVV